MRCLFTLHKQAPYFFDAYESTSSKNLPVMFFIVVAISFDCSAGKLYLTKSKD
jgi:hypothetical protein